MKKYNRFLNLISLISGFLMIFSGLLIQVNYHMAQLRTIAKNEIILGISYPGWSNIHKYSIIIFSMAMIFHLSRHWLWYKNVITKKLTFKNKQLVSLTLIFILVALTGFIPWIIQVIKGNTVSRIVFIEIHDKLAIIFTIFLVLHVGKKLKNIFPSFHSHVK